MSKDEMNDLQEPRAEDPKLEEAVARLRDLYSRYKSAGIEAPLTSALFSTWQEVYADEMPRVRK